jgi:hypothetical protein
MRSYLLGNLSPERHAELGLLIRGEAELTEEVHAIEEELIDQYLAGQLNAGEQQLFETNFLTTPDRLQRLDFGIAFKEYRDHYSPRVPAPETPPMSVSSPMFATSNRDPTFAVLLIVVTGLLVAAAGWLFVKISPEQLEAAHSLEPLVVTLAPGSMRSGGSIKNVNVPAKNDNVKLELQLAKSEFKKYKTQLFRENEALQSQDELKTEPRNAHYVVPVTVTGEILTPGDYQLKLSGVADSGQPEFIDSYPFRVITK